jgi:hypothetical protein
MINNPKGEADNLVNIGITLTHVGDYKRALEYFVKAKKIFSNLGIIDLIQKVDVFIEEVKKYIQ